MDEKKNKKSLLGEEDIDEILREEKEKGKKTKGMIGTILTVIILSICVGGFCFSAYTLYGYYRTYKDGEEEYEKLRSYIQEDEEEGEYKNADAKGEKKSQDKKTKKDTFAAPKVNFSDLKEINPDIVGWIKVQGTVMNYPIVQSGDNIYYLKRTFEKQSNYSGAIFMDYLNEPDFSSDNTVLYGHNMKNGEMFGGLQKYEKEDYVEDHKYIWIITPKYNYKYEIFASYKTDERSEVYTLEFNSFESMDDWFRLAKESSYFPSDSILIQDDKILTLSTCVSESDEGRRVVQAKLIKTEEHED